MKECNVAPNMFVAKSSEDMDMFCLSARATVEKFILACRELNLIPSYDFFRLWMEAIQSK
jgi:hypothetical protein